MWIVHRTQTGVAKYPDPVKPRLRVLIVGISAATVGVVAYIIALALGATHTACSGNAGGAGYCDVHAGHWVVVALLVGAVIGGSASAWSLWKRTPS